MTPVRRQNTLATVRSGNDKREMKPKPQQQQKPLHWFSYSNLSLCRKVCQNAKLIIMRKSVMCLCLQECSTINSFHKYTASLYCSSGRFLWLPMKCAVIIKYMLVRTQTSFRGQTLSETGTVTDFLHEDVRWVCPQECRLTLTITPPGS